MNIHVMRIRQAGRDLYLGAMTARDLLDTCVTTEWDPAIGWDIERQGYQRAPVERHYRAIGRFLESHQDPCMPTAALLSAREREYGVLEFNRVAGGSGFEFGELVIPDGRQLFIVDYQHRWRGFRHAIDDLAADSLREFAIPVVIMTQVPRCDEVLQFYLINSKQRRIDTDLALLLLQTLAGTVDKGELGDLAGPGRFYRIRGTLLTCRLAARTSGPWVGKIAQPHDLPQPGAVIKLKSVVDSLAPVLSKRASCSSLDDDNLLDVLVRFWDALKAIVPKSFGDPTSQIQRTVGVYTFHIVFARHLYPRLNSKGDTSTETFRVALLPVASEFITDRFWAAKGPAKIYVGSSGYRELARRIIEALQSSAT